MQKTSFFLLIVLALFAPSCSKGAFESVSADHANLLASYKVTSSDLMNYFLGIKGIVPTKVSDISVEPIVNGLDTVMYLVNYDDGWEVLSGDRRLSKTLISSDSGSTTMADISTNPLLASYINDLSASIARIEADDSFRTPAEMKDAWNRWIVPEDSISTLVSLLVQTEVLIDTLEQQNHLLQTKWGQGEPWNEYAPYKSSAMSDHCLTGCTPVAAAQVLYYLHNKIGLPEFSYGTATCNAYLSSQNDYLILTSSDISFSDYSIYHWSNMALSSSDTTGSDLVSALMMRIGYLYGAKYKYNSTSAAIDKALTVFPQWGIGCSSYLIPDYLSGFVSRVREQTYINKLPVLMDVYKEYLENGQIQRKGHAIVIDGFKYYHHKVREQYAVYEVPVNGTILPGQQPVNYYYTTTEEETTSVAINWGYNGRYDSTPMGTPIWYNAFGTWVAGLNSYDIKSQIIYDFHSLY